MRCSECENPKKLSVTTKRVKYEVSGLKNVTILKAKVFQCDNCGERYTQYGNIEKINNSLAKALLKKGSPLTGKEVRFLRTWKGYSGRRFSDFLRCTYEHLYRIEAQEDSVNPKFDRLVRLAILSLEVDRNYEITKLFESKTKKKYGRIEITLTKNNPKVVYI